MIDNFTLQDVRDSFLAFLLFSLIFVAPGYVIGYLLDLFDFRHRSSASRFIIAIVLSVATSPILIFLVYHFTSGFVTISLIISVGVCFGIILFKQKQIFVPTELSGLYRTALLLAITWVIFSILFLVDIQWGNRLYYNIISYDLTTRVAIINAITRSGVPPINPSYYPGHPVRLTYLYYFWYIPCSIVTQIGSSVISGYTAMIASVAWCGLSLMAAIALYLRLRNPGDSRKAWRSSLLGIGFLLVSGLDIIPALALMFTTRLTAGGAYLDGDIEHWNEQITAWIGSISWAPHHVAALIACLAGVMLIQSIRDQVLSKQIRACLIAGLAFASAIGLSIYVTFVFILFWGIWMLVRFCQKERRLGWLMALVGIIAFATASPFLFGLISGNNPTSTTGIPLTFSVRTFTPILFFFSDPPHLLLNLLSLFTLPINYFMELGFFFITGGLWIQHHRKGLAQQNSYYLPEIILLSVTVGIGSFVQSTAIASNDLGWRAWLPGQFILLIWSVDVIKDLCFKGLREVNRNSEPVRISRLLRILTIIGLMTTIADVVLLRIWPMLVDAGIAGFPSSLSPDTQLGKRTFAARLTYELIDGDTPVNTVIQYNPGQRINRPAGLYNNRQMAISDITAYGVSRQELGYRSASISSIFGEADWNSIDESCKSYYINVLVINDLDPIWGNLSAIEKQRKPIYQNQYYAVFTCGDRTAR